MRTVSERTRPASHPGVWLGIAASLAWRDRGSRTPPDSLDRFDELAARRER